MGRALSRDAWAEDMELMGPSELLMYIKPPRAGLTPSFNGPDLLCWIDASSFEVLEPEMLGPAEPIYKILHRNADEIDCVSRCYFIGGEEGLVKIGHSINPPGRLRTIQAYSPVILSILATCPGGEDRESAYHAQFAARRRHGEWFERCPEILAEIARLTPVPEDEVI